MNDVSSNNTVEDTLPKTRSFDEVIEVVETAKGVFKNDLAWLSDRGGMSEEVYHRYLSFQYHLTKGVQRHFLKCAAHPQLAHMHRLREFLFRFGMEEEPHYRVAEVDLERLDKKPLPCLIDVSLWWAYFDQIVESRPFVRLGTTCVLENLGAGAGDLGHALLDNAPFLTKSNTRFLTIHFHEALPHGDQIFEALRSAPLEACHLNDLIEGANVGSMMYLRMSRWATGKDDLASAFTPYSNVDRWSEHGRYLDLEDLTSC